MNPLPNWSQVSGIADRIVLIGLGYLAGKGIISSGDVPGLTVMIVGMLGAVYAFYVNRNTNLAKQAASIPGTVVITTPAIANATPAQENIVSKDDVKVVTK